MSKKEAWRWRQNWYSEEFGRVALFPGPKPFWSWGHLDLSEFGLRCHQILLFSSFFFPLTLLLHIILSFFKFILTGRTFKRCMTITNNKEITVMIFCDFCFFYFLIHKILKHRPEGKSQLPFKCGSLWIFGRNTFKSGLRARLPFKAGKCLQKYDDQIHISHNCESDQQCPWVRIVKRTNPASFS